MESVFFEAVSSYDSTRLNDAVENILSGCGLDNLVTPQSRVLLKVNLLMKAAPQKAVTTHPSVVAAVIGALKRRGVQDIVIADSPAGPSSAGRLKSVYEESGMASLAGDGVTLSYEQDTVLISDKAGRLKDIEVMSSMLSADVLINIGKLKTHAMTGLTAAVKNCLGAVAGLKKSVLHFRFAKKADFCAMLCELCAAVSPAVSIIDAVTGMEGDGPSGGIPRDFGFIAGSRDPFVLDRALCHALGLTPADAHTVGASVLLNLAPDDAAVLDIRGDRQFFDHPIGDLKMPASRDFQDFESVPRGFRVVAQWFMRSTSPYPVIRKKDCIGCGRCAEICPKSIIEIKDKKAVIQTKECMRCFCCHEVCPARAIDIKRKRTQKDT